MQYKSPLLKLAFFIFCILLAFMLREIVRAEKVDTLQALPEIKIPLAIPQVPLEVEQPLILPKTSHTYIVTAYCACNKCCGEWSDGFTYSGDLAVEGITAAADLSKLPLGTVVNIEGWGERTIQDIGGAIKSNRIDLYFWNHSDALAFGVQELEVTVIE